MQHQTLELRAAPEINEQCEAGRQKETEEGSSCLEAVSCPSFTWLLQRRMCAPGLPFYAFPTRRAREPT